MSEPTMSLPYSPYVAYDPNVRLYQMMFGILSPWEYTGWQDEVMSWKETAYLHGGLNPTQTYRLWGPDALRLLSEHCVNSFAEFPIGAAKHAVMCDDEGLVMAHGVLVRESDEEFTTYWLMPWIDYLVEHGDYDVEGENLTGRLFLLQLAGPRSLEILEAITNDDLRDIGFLRQRSTTIAGAGVTVGAEVDVLRLGMAGSLAYEIHGPVERAREVYDAIVAAGIPYGLRRLGGAQYMMNHTENGFPQGHMHFLFPWFEDPGLAAHLQAIGIAMPALRGSAGPDLSLRYRNPIELGWGHIVRFDHDFQGRAALEREAADPKRKMVTLAWNADDVLDVFRSYLEPGEQYKYMNFTQEHFSDIGGANSADLVVKDGETVGISSGRIYSYYYHQMISLCSIDVEHGDLGDEVTVVWGEPDGRQKEIRATVERFPFYDENRNETVDVSRIPHSGTAA